MVEVWLTNSCATQPDVGPTTEFGDLDVEAQGHRRILENAYGGHRTRSQELRPVKQGGS
jgi:hypothetical protein